jgi:hypothetical protein
MPIIALGRPGEHVGAGRIETSDATWKADITRMIEASEMALCVPSATEGTLWELDFLVKRDLLDKTVFIMPPATRHVNYAREWERVRQSPIQDVLALPPYVPEGVLFRARGGGGGGGVEVFAPLRLEQFLVQEMYVGGGSQSDDSSSRADESGDGESKSQEAAAASPVPTAAEIGVAAALFGASPDLEIAWTTEAAEVASFDAGDDSTDSDSTSADSGGGGGDSGGGGGDSGNG